MEEKFTSYDQIRNSYSGENIQPSEAADQPASETVQPAPPPAQAEPVHPAVAQPTPPPQPETQSTHAATTGQDATIFSLSQSLSTALHYQQVLEEKLATLIQCQERQEKANQELVAQQQALMTRVEALSSKVSALSTQHPAAPVASAEFDEMRKVLTRAERSNLDAIRESKNFQQTLYAKQNNELDGYRKLHADTANANIMTEIANFRNAAEDVARHLDDTQAKNLRIGVVEAIDDFLVENGVTVHETPIGQRRSLRTCQTRKQVPTGDESLHGTVAYSVAPSFAIGNLILMKEIVDTYVYDPSLKEPAKPEETETPSEAPSTSQAVPEEAPAEPATEAPAGEKVPADQPQNAAPTAEATPDQGAATV